MSNYYAEILTTLVDHDVTFIVAGGVACVLHGVERVTMDVDIAIEMTQENIERFVSACTELELSPRVPVPIHFLLDPANREKLVREKNALVFSLVDPALPMRHIDVFLRPDHGYDYLLDDAETIEIRGRKVRIASIQKIIAMKSKVEPMREKDKFDISMLEKLQRRTDD